MTVSVFFDELHHTVSIIIAENNEESPELAEKLRTDDLEDWHQVLVRKLSWQRPNCLHKEEVLWPRILS